MCVTLDHAILYNVIVGITYVLLNCSTLDHVILYHVYCHALDHIILSQVILVINNKNIHVTLDHIMVNHAILVYICWTPSY
jgi:hypothetical protein